MRPVYRISLAARAIRIEVWPDWAAFDASPPAASAVPSDLAYALDDRMQTGDADGARFEIRRIRVNNGLAAEARALVRQESALSEAAGARTVGVFELIHGHDLPAMLFILEWQREDAARRLQGAEMDEALAASHRSQRLRSSRAAIRATSRTIGCTLSVAGIDMSGSGNRGGS